jgi:two-component sensor histidine kinase
MSVAESALSLSNSANFGTVVRNAIEAFDNPAESKFSISGPDIQVTSGAVIAITMTLNELCTNATKFGALSVPEGASTSSGR